MKKTVNDTKIYPVQNSKINRENGHLTSSDCFVLQKGCSKPKVFKDKFTLQIYTAEELREILVRNGFKVLGQYGIDGSKLLEHKTMNILTVAKKD